MPLLFRREEGLEDAAELLRRDAAATVRDLDHRAVALAAGADRNGPRSAHRVDRVVDDVGPDLVETAAERPDGRQAPVVVAPDLHILEAVGEDCQGVLDAVV